MMAVGDEWLNTSYYMRKGVEIYQEDRETLHFFSPYTCSRVFVNDSKDNIRIILSLSKDKTLGEVISDLNLDRDNLNIGTLAENLKFLREQGVIFDGPPDSILSEEEVEYHSKNISYLHYLYNQNGLNLLEKLKEKSVGLIGLGGSGSALLASLAGSGVGEIRIVDYDKIEPSNIPRQIFYNFEDVGRLKTEVMEERLRGRNPFLKIKKLNLKLAEKNMSRLEGFLDGCDFVVSAADEPSYSEVLHLVQEICFRRGIPFMGASPNDGSIPPLVVPGKTSCITCLKTLQSKFLGKNQDRDKLKLEGFLWGSQRSVPFCLLEGNTVVAEEILKFLLFGKSALMNHFRAPSGKMIFVPRSGGCGCRSRAGGVPPEKPASQKKQEKR